MGSGPSCRSSASDAQSFTEDSLNAGRLIPNFQEQLEGPRGPSGDAIAEVALTPTTGEIASTKDVGLLYLGGAGVITPSREARVGVRPATAWVMLSGP